MRSPPKLILARFTSIPYVSQGGRVINFPPHWPQGNGGVSFWRGRRICGKVFPCLGTVPLTLPRFKERASEVDNMLSNRKILCLIAFFGNRVVSYRFQLQKKKVGVKCHCQYLVTNLFIAQSRAVTINFPCHIGVFPIKTHRFFTIDYHHQRPYGFFQKKMVHHTSAISSSVT